MPVRSVSSPITGGFMKLHWPDILQFLHRKKPALRDALKNNPTSTRKAITQAILRGEDAASEKAAAVKGELRNISRTAANPGNLRFYEFIPSRLPQKAPLVVLLHGCGQHAANYVTGSGWGQLAQRHGFALLVAEQKSSNNPNRCFNWFQPADIARGNGEAHSIHAMTIRQIAAHELDAQRIFITGLSAGGAMATAMLASHPETFNAGAVLAGLPYGAANNIGQAFSAMLNPVERSARDWGDLVRRTAPDRENWPRLAIWHGTKDRTVSPANAMALEKQWCDLHGLSADRVEEIDLPGITHRIWRNEDGITIVESVLIKGMDHGVPIDATGRNGPATGQPGPFFPDIGLSSTHNIARSWNLL